MTRLTPTKLFLDGGDPVETAAATRLLNEAGYAGLDGQTTNPSLVAKNPDIAARIARGEKLNQEELLAKYREIVQAIEADAAGDISIEVYADAATTADDLIAQARDMGSWIESAVIKLPITAAGLQAGEVLKDELRLNFTLCFSQAQAAAVHAATRGGPKTVYVSPFIGRLDDRGENGMDLIHNILKMYGEAGSHVEVLTASVRSVEHILGALAAGTHALTVPFEKVFTPWAEAGFTLPAADYAYQFDGAGIAYAELDPSSAWTAFDIQHELTEAGLQKFADDWNGLLSA